MKKWIVVAVIILAPCAAQAQFGVTFDPTVNASVIASKVAEVAQMAQTFTQAQQQYSFFQGMAQQLLNMPARYRAMFANWQNILRAADMYGNTSSWNSAVNTGTVGGAYTGATNTLSSYNPTSWAAMTNDMQQRVMSKVATIELMDAANPNAMQMIGQVRANGLNADSQLGNLDTDTMGGALDTQIQVAQQQAVASVTTAHLQADANKLMLSQTEALLLQAKQQRDDQVAGLAADVDYKANVANVIQSGSSGLGAAMDSFN